MKYLVTGGCGFIGSNFLRHFFSTHPNASVINLDKLTYAGVRENTKSLESNLNYEFVQGDICDSDLVRKLMRRVEGVIHFAAESHVDRSIDSGTNFVMTNVYGTHVLLEAAKECGVKRFLHFSTDEVYGSTKDHSFTEESPLNPTSPYSSAKASSDLLALAYWKTHKVPIVLIRSSNNFGPYQFPEKVIPLFITNLIEGKKVPLYAKGANVRDWLYVGDCVRAVDFILENGKSGEIYNVGGNTEITNIELTRSILKQFNKGEEAIQYVQDRPAHDFRYSLNTDKLKKLGFNIEPQFEKRLKETISWYQSNRSWWEALKTDTYTLK